MAVQVNSSLQESRDQVVSVVSDFLVRGDGSFVIPGLQPGNYVVYIEPINPAFKGGSGVGPFDNRLQDFVKDYYNGVDESGTSLDDPTQKIVLSVSPGQTVPDIDMVVNEANSPPAANAGADQSVTAGAKVSLNGSGSDPDGDSLTFHWSQTVGPSVLVQNSSSPTASFTAPDVSITTTLAFRLTVSDGVSETSDAVRVTVNPSGGTSNSPPAANAGSDQSVLAGARVSLQGSGSDPDGDSLTFHWTQIAGPSVLVQDSSFATASFTAPAVSVTTILAFRLTVSDGSAEGSDTVRVSVNPADSTPANLPPTADAGPDQTVNKGQSVELKGNGSDPDGDLLSYSWRQTSGPVVFLETSETTKAHFTAPTLPTDQTLVFRLTVTDEKGGSTSDDVSIRVLKDAAPSIIESPKDQLVPPGVDLVLSVQATDSDDEVLDYQWTQTAGPAVTFSRGDGPEVRFRTPDVAEKSVVELEVAVSDATTTVTASAKITVLPPDLILAPLSMQGVDRYLSNSFVGVAAVNTGSSADDVDLSALTASGETAAGYALESNLVPNGQLAFLTSDLEGIPSGSTLLNLKGRSESLAGFFMVGDFTGTKLDGISGKLEPSTRLIFPRVGSSDQESTILMLFNPGTEDASPVQVTLFDAQGRLLHQVSLALAASGSVMASLRQLFEDGLQVRDGYIRVESNVPLEGVEFSAGEQTLTSLKAQLDTPVHKLFVPHFFVDRFGGTTVLHFLNLDSNRSTIKVRAFANDGASLGEAEFQVEPGHLASWDVVDLLDLDPAQLSGSNMFTGYLEVETISGLPGLFQRGAHVIGTVQYTANSQEAQSSLPMMRSGQNESLFLQVAQSLKLGMFTGFAILNPGEQEAEVHIEVFSESGQQTAEKDLRIAPRTRLVDLLNSPAFFGPDFDQVGGHVRLTSSEPVMTFALFGDFRSQYLSAIEAY